MAAKKTRIDVHLVDSGLVATRSRAQALIMAGKILVNDVKIDKSGELVDPESNIRIIEDEHPWVSRGALKLLKGLEYFDIDPAQKVCLDAGASTGGFTEVLLTRDAAMVHAVDVGYGQLDWKIRNDPRVKVYERTNIRDLKPGELDPPPALAVCDVSFISLKLVIPVFMSVLVPGSDVICLIKPQFEAGKGRVGKGGVVRDPQVRQECIDSIVSFLREKNIEPTGTCESPITGPKGNVEYLIHFKV
ncbi:TlyA family RNA methyltransferase [Myxococcota bacterium]|nr:TlyA family RNA methyltransferase [Myxococcota bacterium]MBU1381529.1 TlyA family RNA methyltransferase [Myxococcota bacterium]MBU1496548.1 TlyA family RNA methyltransferase [Myxococcota bacterium]